MALNVQALSQGKRENTSFSGEDSGMVLLVFSIVVFYIMSPHGVVGGFGPLELEMVLHPGMNGTHCHSNIAVFGLASRIPGLFVVLVLVYGFLA